jgi:catechol 2,3-dioxygenase-like lactoylglutathione lyase family enzyme
MDLMINIDVDDLKKAIAFYEKALGLRVGRRFDFGVELLGGSSPIYLLLKEEGTQATSMSANLRRYRRHWTPIHLDVVVDDIGEAVGRALEAGATLEGDIRAHEWGHLAMMADPFGHGLCFIQFAGRGYDEIALRDKSAHRA